MLQYGRIMRTEGVYRLRSWCYFFQHEKRRYIGSSYLGRMLKKIILIIYFYVQQI